jgi:hypothetical protein
MNASEKTGPDADQILDSFAADVTDAAYPIALKYGFSGSTLVTLELEIWNAVSSVAHKHAQELLAGTSARQLAAAGSV